MSIHAQAFVAARRRKLFVPFPTEPILVARLEHYSINLNSSMSFSFMPDTVFCISREKELMTWSSASKWALQKQQNPSLPQILGGYPEATITGSMLIETPGRFGYTQFIVASLHSPRPLLQVRSDTIINNVVVSVDGSLLCVERTSARSMKYSYMVERGTLCLYSLTRLREVAETRPEVHIDFHLFNELCAVRALDSDASSHDSMTAHQTCVGISEGGSRVLMQTRDPALAVRDIRVIDVDVRACVSATVARIQLPVSGHSTLDAVSPDGRFFCADGRHLCTLPPLSTSLHDSAAVALAAASAPPPTPKQIKKGKSADPLLLAATVFDLDLPGDDHVYSAAFSADSRLLFVHHNQGISIFDCETRQPLAQRTVWWRNMQRSAALRASPCGKYLMVLPQLKGKKPVIFDVRYLKVRPLAFVAFLFRDNALSSLVFPLSCAWVSSV